jgi:GNAT superfamily N-acetyltransferase
MTVSALNIQRADYANPADCAAFIAMLDEYARSAMGGGKALAPSVRLELPARMAAMPTAFTGLAWRGDEAVGIVNCFETLSTFKARPIINIHDLAVTATVQGQGVGTALLGWVEMLARQRGCCKLTLEVLEGNTQAQSVYRRTGFVSYALDPQHGQAQFWEKPLLDNRE